MTIAINATISSLISTQLALAVVTVTGNAKMLPIMRKSADSIAISFTTQATSIVMKDLQVNIAASQPQTIGLYSNMNTANSNISPVTLAGLTAQYSSSILIDSLSSLLVSLIFTTVIQTAGIKLPSGFNQQMINRLLIPLVRTTIVGVINSIIAVFVNNTYSNYTPPLPNSDDDINDVDTTTDSVQASISQSSVSQTKAFNTFSDSNMKSLNAGNTGFIDPNATYPKSEYAGISETNKLAQGIISGTVVQDKFNNRMTGAPLPDGDSFSEPPPAYNSKYPHNKVTETVSGHVIEIDDTPGSERIHVYHASGTYYEIDAVGNVIHRCDGSEFNIIDCNGYTSIHGNGNISIGGELKVMVCGNAHIEVTGDAIINGYNNVEVNAAGRLQLSGGEAIDMRAPNIYIEADNELHITAATLSRQEYGVLDVIVNGDNTTTTTGDFNNTVEGDVLETIKGNVDLNVTGNLTSTTKGHLDITANPIHINSGGVVDITASADIVLKPSGAFSASGTMITLNSEETINLTAIAALNFNAGGVFMLDASTMDLMSGASSAVPALSTTNASSAGTSSKAQEADLSQAGLLDGRHDFVNIQIDDGFPSNFVDDKTLNSDDVMDATTSTAIQNDLIKNGLAQPSDFTDTPIADGTDESKPKSLIPWVHADNKLLSLVNTPPDNFMLSPHFSLGMLSSRAPAQPNRVVAQCGLSVGQLVFNLSEVALNVLEPLLSVYPNMVVTSAFRNIAESHSTTSAHPFGHCVDMQFKGVAKGDYYKIARQIKNLVGDIDQLLLEFKTSGTGMPWIHVGVRNINGVQRNQVSTMFNNSIHGSGLIQLA